MSKGKMIIGNAHSHTGGGIVRLCADINNNGKNFTMTFDFPEKYGEYICMEYADPFVLMALEYAMAKQYDIECEQAMTEKLYYQLTNYFIPLLSENTKTFHKIALSAKTVPTPNYKATGVGTGMSCGVDSLHTVLKYKDFPMEKYKLTHLLFLNNGAMGDMDYKKSCNIFKLEKQHLQNASNELGIELICVNTNMVALYGEIAEHRANNNEGPKIASVVYAMRKLFSIYYIASTVGIERFHFSDSDVGYFAPFTAGILSSDVRFYVGDLDTARRIDKVKAIADNRVAQKYLHVNTVRNCGKCPKCIRTMAELWTLDKLDLFAEVFDIQNFKKHFFWRMSNYFSNKKEWDFGYAHEIIREAKNNGKDIPLVIFAVSFLILKPNKQIISFIKNTALGRQLRRIKHKYIKR